MAPDRRVGRSATAGSGPEAGVSRSELILDAAIELFRVHGYHSVGIDEYVSKFEPGKLALAISRRLARA